MIKKVPTATKPRGEGLKALGTGQKNFFAASPSLQGGVKNVGVIDLNISVDTAFVIRNLRAPPPLF